MFSFLQSEKYVPFATDIVNRFGSNVDEQVSVSDISIPPLGDILKFPRDEAFSVFIPKHLDLAAKLIDIFIGKS